MEGGREKNLNDLDCSEQRFTLRRVKWDRVGRGGAGGGGGGGRPGGGEPTRRSRRRRRAVSGGRPPPPPLPPHRHHLLPHGGHSRPGRSAAAHCCNSRPLLQQTRKISSRPARDQENRRRRHRRRRVRKRTASTRLGFPPRPARPMEFGSNLRPLHELSPPPPTSTLRGDDLPPGRRGVGGELYTTPLPPALSPGAVYMRAW